MPGLSDKLKSLGVKVGARDLPPRRPRSAYSIEQVVPGHFHTTSEGKAFVVETTYPPEYRHGYAPLLLAASLATIADWAKEPRLAQCEPGRMVFLDVETTGLSGGTGTYAFLVGIGRFDGDRFALTQFFMRDPVEEAALLAALMEFLNPLDVLVTFNGKAFDAPILRTRYTMNGYPVPFSSAAHLDLLPLARRLWRERLESRALGSLETYILKATRTEEDIPGWLIPQMYFDYLQSGDARRLKGIFYHNAMDVVAMAALLNHVAQMLDQPFVFADEHGLDMIAIARLFEELGRLDEAAGLYQRAVEHGLPEEAMREAVRRFSFVQRRRGEIQAAVELWREAARTRQIYAYVELAKYYEHKLGDYAEAERQTRAALAVIGKPLFSPEADRRWIKDLDHRLARLKAKRSRVDTN
jgi:uncharacterized protein